VGKTTIAQLLADEWGCRSIDTDDLVSEAVGCPAPEYLRREGLASFRSAELDALRTALDSDGVVSTGGGVVTTSAARELLQASVTLWLDCDDAVLAARVGDIDRPLIGADVHAALAQLRLERATLYAEVSRARIDASGDPDAVAKRVQHALNEVAR
jgi:shikimate kinase